MKSIQAKIQAIQKELNIESFVKLICKCGSDKEVFFRMEFLDTPLCKECYNKLLMELEKKRRIENTNDYLIQAGVYENELEYSFDNFKGDFEELQKLKEYPHQKELYDLIMIGGTGVAKTHLSIAIMRELIKRGCKSHKMHYYTENEIIKILNSSHKENNFEYYYDKFTDYELLIIDDLGRKKPSEATISNITDLIDDRYKKNKKSIINTNLVLESDNGQANILNLYGQPLFSRLWKYDIVFINLPDYRQKKK